MDVNNANQGADSRVRQLLLLRWPLSGTDRAYSVRPPQILPFALPEHDEPDQPLRRVERPRDERDARGDANGQGGEVVLWQETDSTVWDTHSLFGSSGVWVGDSTGIVVGNLSVLGATGVTDLRLVTDHRVEPQRGGGPGHRGSQQHRKHVLLDQRDGLRERASRREATSATRLLRPPRYVPT